VLLLFRSWHFLFSFAILFHLPVSMGNFVLVVLNLQKVKMSLFPNFCNGNMSAPWVKFVKDILDNCGLSNVWTFQNINFNTEWVIVYVKLREITASHYIMKFVPNLISWQSWYFLFSLAILFHLPVSMGNFLN
jgi:hypothetical protein